MSIGGGLLLGVVTAVGVRFGPILGTLVATAFVYDALFRNPPLPATDPRVAATAVVWHAIRSPSSSSQPRDTGELRPIENGAPLLSCVGGPCRYV